MEQADRMHKPGGQTSAPAEQAGGVSRARQKRLVLVAMAVLFFVSGVLWGSLPDEPDQAPASGVRGRVALVALDVLGVIAFHVLAYVWCQYDRLERGKPRWRRFAFLVIVCPGPLVMAPVYLCATRGTRGLWATAKAAVLLAVLLGLRLGADKLTAMLRGCFVP